MMFGYVIEKRLQIFGIIILMIVETINKLDKEEFINIFKNIFEHSDFITHDVENLRPFRNKLHLIDSFMNIFDSLSRDVKINIIKSHPDLGDKIKIAEGLSNFSKQEQSGAGLANCNDMEYSKFHKLNDKFKSKFRIPFIFAIRGKTKSEIFDEFERRLKSDNIEQELDKSLNQVKKIASLRLNEIIYE